MATNHDSSDLRTKDYTGDISSHGKEIIAMPWKTEGKNYVVNQRELDDTQRSILENLTMAQPKLVHFSRPGAPLYRVMQDDKASPGWSKLENLVKASITRQREAAAPVR